MSLSSNQLRALQRTCSLWEGTPYVAGQCVPGKSGGVDCVRFTDQGLQATYGLALPPLPRHAQDAAFHSKEVIQEMTRLFFERFDLFVVRDPQQFKPADLVICRQIVRGLQTPSTPGGHHVALVGATLPRCFDAWPGVGVRRTSIGGLRSGFKILKVYRSRMGYDETE